MRKFYLPKLSRLYVLCLALFTFSFTNSNAQVSLTATAGTPTGTFIDLSSAFAAINAGTHQGDIVIDINASFTDAAVSVLNGSGAGAALYTSVLVRPSVDGVTMSFATATGRGIIELNGADNITIDGDNPNTAGTNQNLTIVNTAANTVTFTSVIRLASSTLVTSNNNITVRNSIINGNAAGRNASGFQGTELTSWGIVVSGLASTVSATTAPSALTSNATLVPTGETALNFTCTNNAINRCSRGIALNGSATSVCPVLTITNNVIGNPTLGAVDQVSVYGMTIQGFSTGTIISGNTIYVEGFASNTPSAIAGIDIGSVSATGADAIIERNIVARVRNNHTGTWGSWGISLGSATPVSTNITLRNNTVYGVNHNMSGGIAFSTTFGLMGIRVAGGNNNKIYYNSVNLSEAMYGTATTSHLSAAFAITATTIIGTDVRNNIFANTTTGGSTSIAHVAMSLPTAGTSAMNTTFNNNIYYSGSTAGVHGVAHVNTTYLATPAGPASYNGLYSIAAFNPAAITPNAGAAANLRAYTSILSAAGTNDNASFASNVAAPFTSATNLHLNSGAGNFSNADGKGTTIAGITTDFDNDTRHPSAPDIGMDEITVACVTAAGGTITPATASVCANATYFMTATGVTTDLNITYQWEVSTTGGGAGFSNVTGGTGATTPSYTTGALAAGTYYYRLNVTCSAGPITAYSNELVVTVNAAPSVSVTPPSGSTCSVGGSPVSLTASGATTYSWSPAAGLSATTGATVTANPTSTTTYTVTGTAAGCTGTSTVTITTVITPVTPVITPASSSLCPGGNVSLTATSFFTGILGNGALVTTLSSTGIANFPNPLAHYYGGNKHQILILASELSSLGMINGSQITSIGLPVASVNNTTPLQSFMVAMGHSVLTSISTFQTGLTTVRNAATYAYTGGVGIKTITFDTPFTWNGVDNIVLETSFSNNDAPSAGNVTMTYGNTAFQSTIVYRNDNQTGPVMNAYTGATSFTMSARPNITFNHTHPSALNGANIVWSPGTGLSATTGNTVTATPASTTTYTVQANNAGCTSTANVTVTVGDLINPTITCPATVNVNADAGLCTASGVTLGTPVTADNCSVASVTNNAPATFPVGTTVVIWTVTDGVGNTATCNQNVIVTDNQNPTITCPSTVTANADAGLCTASGVALGTPATADNCGVASVTNNAPAAFPIGNTTVTWTVTDVNGNTNTCTQTITVTDNQNPTITCPATVNVNMDAGICTASGVSLGTPTTADNCGVASVTNNAPATYPIGNTTVTWTVIDVNGNTSTCTQTVTVTDNQNPTITCPATVTVPANAGVCTASAVSLGTPTTADNCGVASVTNNAPATFPLGNTTVTWTVTDVNGNTTTCAQTVTVTDNQNPTITCPANVNVNADAGLCTASGVTLGTPATADNCSVASVTNNAPATYAVGVTSVTWTVTDGSGNTATCVQTVTVTDNQNPTITCPANVNTNTNVGSCTATGVSLGTPATADNCGVASVTNDAPGSFPIGVTIVTWTVTDVNGHSATCAQTVTVTDNENPTIVCPANVSANTNPSACVATGVVLGTPVTADNCSVASVTNNAPASFPSGTTIVTWTVTDASGNTATCTQTVTVTDNEAPVAIGCSSNISIQANNTGCTGIATWTAPTASDNCAASVTITSNHNSGEAFPIGTTVVTYTFNDGNGNTSTCTFNVTVTNNLSASATATNATCNGSAGAIDLTVAGGNVPYTFDWNNDGTGDNDDFEDINPLAGSYTVTVTDVNGCTTATTASLSEPTAINASVVSTSNPTGCALTDGSVDVSVTGGTPGYMYDWDNDGTGDNDDTQDLTGIGSGTHILVITDANGCTSTLSANLTDPNGPSITVDAVTPVSCNGGNNGAIDITVTLNGTATSFTALWNDPSATTTEDVSGLSAGIYSVTVTDNNGCIGSVGATISEPTALQTISSHTNTSCNGVTDGSVDITVSGGAVPYIYDWDNDGTGDNDDAEDLNGLAAGMYTVIVTDPNGCTDTVSVNITEPAVITPTGVVTNTSCITGASDGLINLTVAGGTPGYMYDWDNDGTGDNDDTEDLTGLAAATYNVTVTDANGCTGSASFTVVTGTSPTFSYSVTLCAGNSITVGSSTYNTTGVYTDVFTLPNGCDSTVISNLTVNPPVNVATSSTSTSITAQSTGGNYQWIDCNNNGAIISGATSQTFNPAANGSYAVIVTELGCPDSSACVNVTGISIAEIASENFRVYPNPSSGVFNIEATTSANAVVVNMLGEQIQSLVIYRGKNQLNLDNVACGPYMLRLTNSTTGETMMLQRLMIQK